MFLWQKVQSSGLHSTNFKKVRPVKLLAAQLVYPYITHEKLRFGKEKRASQATYAKI